jgi:PKD repeat protein
MKRIVPISIALLLLSNIVTFSQPISDFIISDSVCLNQNIELLNISANFDSLVWDFSRSELDSITAIELSTNITDSNIPTSITYVYDSLRWYAFVSSRNSNSLFRLDYGKSLNNTPVLTNLGNISGLLSGPKNIEFIKEDGLWYALLVNYGNSSLLRIKFDNGLENPPSATSLGNLSGWNILRGLELVRVTGELYAAVSSFNNNKTTILSFGTSITNPPTVFNDITDELISGPIGIRLVNSNNKWFAFIASNKNNKILKVSFGTDLSNTPTITELLSVPKPTELKFWQEGLIHHLFTTSESGSITQIKWKDNIELSATATKNWGNFGLLSKSFGFDLVYDFSNYYAFSLNYASKSLHKLSFDPNSWKVFVSDSISNETNPKSIHYFKSDTFEVVLNAFDEYGNVSTHSDTIVVKNSSAPNISFSTANACLDLYNTFTASSDNLASIVSWEWDFGDTQTSSASQSVDHQFTSEGDYLVSLAITSDDGCTNSSSDSVSIEQPQTPSFDVPSSNLCTNVALEFENTSNNISSTFAEFVWKYDESAIDTAVHGGYIYSEIGEQTITLYADLTGCIDSTKQTITLSSGPSVEFDWTNNCFGDSISFLNGSKISNTTSRWDFGDGSAENYLINPKHLYLDIGAYEIQLMITDTIVGCSSRLLKHIEISNELKASFEKPQLMTVNIPEQFKGDDLTFLDDSVTSWSWIYDGEIVSILQNPILAFPRTDSIILELDFSTMQGCNGKYQDTIVIQPAYKPLVSVNTTDELCIDERADIENNTINGQSYFWDFCLESFDSSSGSSFIKTVDNANIPEGIEGVYSFGQWHAFICSRQNSKLFRLDFGSSLENDPAIIDLGNPDGFLSSPKDIKLINENGQWYGVLANMGSSNLIRYSFGDSLNSIPSGEIIGNLDGWSSLRGIDIYTYSDSVYVSVSSHNTHKISILNFGISITHNPGPTNVITVADPVLSKPMGISLLNDGNNWRAIVCSHGNNKALLLDFGNSLNESPDVYELGELSGITDCKLFQSGLKYFGIFSSSSNLYKTDFGQEIDIANNPVLEQISNIQGMSNVFNIGITKAIGGWELFSVSYSTKDIYQFQFYEDCALNSLDFEPTDISYSSPGTYPIELTAFSSNGNFDTYMDTVVVRDATAPTISFNTQNACIENQNSFAASSSDDPSITTWNWDFGDGTGTASGQSVEYQYDDTGTFDVCLAIDAENGCSNSASKKIHIYNPPNPSFSYTSGVTCSNSPLDFVNSTAFSGPDSLLSFEWNMNDEMLLDDSDPSYVFKTGGEKNVTLTAYIPGCNNVASELIDITPGPETAFTFQGSCEQESFTFSNATTGNGITGYRWDFGDGYTSTVPSPIHRFESAGSFPVSLTASNELGCNTTLQQVVAAQFLPVPNFTNDLACSDKEVTFYDQSSVSNANIIDRQWRLSNSSIGYSQQASGPSPTFQVEAEGQYRLRLIVESNYGCVDTLIRDDVTVNPSPTADFVFSNTCFGDETLFSEAAMLPPDTDINTVDWLINDNLFTANEVTYQFLTPGSYPVEMFVRASNFCTDNTSKTIDINPLPTLDILVTDSCESYPVSINVTVDSPLDPVESYGWMIDEKLVSSLDGFSYVFDSPGTYEIALAVATRNNCTNSSTETIDIHPIPNSGFEVFPSIGASPLNVAFTDRSSGAKSVIYDFSIYNDDVSADDNTSYIYTDVRKDWPQQIAFNDFGCTDTSFVEIEAVIPIYDIAMARATTETGGAGLQMSFELINNGTIIINNPVVKIDLGDNASLNHPLTGRIMPGENRRFDVDFEVLNANKGIRYICFEAPTMLGAYEDVNPYDNANCVSIEQSFSVFDPYPNPSQGQFFLPIVLPETASCELSVFGEKGELVWQRNFQNAKKGLNLFQINASNYGQGVFLLSIRYEGIETTKKIVLR